MKTNDKRGMNSKERKSRAFPKQIPMEAKRFLIITMISQGKTYTDIMKECQAQWGLGEKTIQNIINETLEYMRSDKAKESLISMNMQRLDSLYADSRSAGDRKSAIKAIDVQNKMVGAYTENIKIDGDSEINLNFEF